MRWVGSIILLILLCGFAFDGFLAHNRAARSCNTLISGTVGSELRQVVEKHGVTPGLRAVYSMRPDANTGTGENPVSTGAKPSGMEFSVAFVFDGPAVATWSCVAQFSNGRVVSVRTEHGSMEDRGDNARYKLEWHR